jgi:hypothetical protein
VLLARAEVARAVLPDGLRARGWEVDVVDAYRTVPATISHEQREALATADVVTFTSSSTVEHLLAAIGTGGLPPHHRLHRPRHRGHGSRPRPGRGGGGAGAHDRRARRGRWSSGAGS